MDSISKIKVDNTTYEIKDYAARVDNNGKVSKSDAVIEGSLSTEGSTASGNKSAAMGNTTMASGNYGTAEGSYTLASGVNSHAEGNHTQATGESAHAEGIGAYDNTTNSWTISTASGEGAHVEGKANVASGDHSHAEGCETQAIGHASHAEGCSNRAAASYSHVEGKNNEIISTADSDGNNETGIISHVEGAQNINRASYAHVEGYNNSAGVDAKYVHIGGKNNQANYENNQIIVGEYNYNYPEDIFEYGGGYLDESGEVNQEVRKNLIRMTKDKMYISLDDVIFSTLVDGNERHFSLTNAAVVDNELNAISTHPVQNKVITEKLGEVFQYVSEGKTLIASALSDLGYQASSDMTFLELANVIRTINPDYEINTEYLFIRQNKYYTTQGTIVNLAAPDEKVGIDIDFYAYSEAISGI